MSTTNYQGTYISGALAPGSADDYWFQAPTTTTDSSQGGILVEDDFVTPGGNGGLGTLAFTYTGSVNTGDRFVVVWFNEAEMRYGGVLSDPSFVLPADGWLMNFDAPFRGNDPIRSSLYSYTGTSGTPTGPGIQPFPEPSSSLLSLLSGVFLLRRRR